MKNILILTYWSYPDALIQTYTLPYVRIIQKNLPKGSSIYMLTLEKNWGLVEELRRSANVLQMEKEGIYWLPFPYRPFGWVAFFQWIGILLLLCFRVLHNRIQTIHCWCTPPGAIGYFLSILLNRKLILDSYEPHAEAMVENGTWKKQSIAFRLLFWLEKKQTERASFIISATEGMFAYASKKYSVIIKHFYVKPACVDFGLFSEREIKNERLINSFGLKNKVVCVYAGKFGGIYLGREVFDFFKIAYNHWGDAFRIVLLTNHTTEEINQYCHSAGLPLDILIIKFVPHEEVPIYMGLGDFAISPIKPVRTKRFCTPIKDGEYWALGLPVVIPKDISDDSDIIEQNEIGAVLSTLDEEAYLKAVLKIDSILQKPRVEVRSKIRKIAMHYRSYEIASKVYKEIYG